MRPPIKLGSEMMGLLAIVTVSTASSSCKTKPDDTKQVSEIAAALCPIDRGGAPVTSTLPPDLAKHVRHEDLEFVEKPADGDAGTPSSGTETATCDVRSVDVKPSTAVVTLTRKTSLGTKDYAINFVKTVDGWKADYHLPERAAARTSAHDLERQASKLLDDMQWDEAKAKLLEARKLAPDDEASIDKEIAAVDELLKTRVAGHWFKLTEADAMTDKQNVWMSLPASTTLWDGFADKRPILTARCIKGKLDVLIAANVVVGGGLDGASVKYRFDSDAPKSEWMVETDDHKGFFVSQARTWLDRIAQHGGKFIVEVPIFQQVPQTITFEVTGADKALAALKAACAN